MSAFAGTNLDMSLPANGIATLILSEIAMTGVVLSTGTTDPDALHFRFINLASSLTGKTSPIHTVHGHRMAKL